MRDLKSWVNDCGCSYSHVFRTGPDNSLWWCSAGVPRLYVKWTSNIVVSRWSIIEVSVFHFKSRVSETFTSDGLAQIIDAYIWSLWNYSSTVSLNKDTPISFWERISSSAACILYLHNALPIVPTEIRLASLTTTPAPISRSTNGPLYCLFPQMK